MLAASYLRTLETAPSLRLRHAAVCVLGPGGCAGQARAGRVSAAALMAGVNATCVSLTAFQANTLELLAKRHTSCQK